MKEYLNIAFFQQDICWLDADTNYARVAEAFSGVEADVMVVPETFSMGFGDAMASMAECEEGASLCFARDMAHKHDALFVGTWPVVTPMGAVYNRLHWVYPDGSYGHYDKAHTFRMSSEASQIARGSCRAIFEWKGWRIKPAVCYDLRFPLWLRNGVRSEDRGLALSLPRDLRHVEQTVGLDYDLLIVCANFPGSRHEAWSTLLKARAIENLAYVVGVNRVGTDGAGIPYTGHSAAIDFKGLPLAECAPNSEEVAQVRLDAKALNEFRCHWPFYLDADDIATALKGID